MSRARFVLAFAAIVAAACTKPTPPPPIEAAAPAAATPIVDASTEDATATIDAGTTWSWKEDCEPIGDLKSAKSIGHTSVVFKLERSNGKKAVFKPHSKKGPNRYRGEVAAYRLAKLLQIGHVVIACPVAIPKAKLEAALASHPDGAVLFAEQVIVDNGSVRGALINWVDKLGFPEFEKEPLASKWKTWLKKGTSVEGFDSYARDVSMMVVFDYLTANWDRWSGGNVGENKDTLDLIFIDNDGAFFENPPKDGLARNKRLLEGMDRFPKNMIERLRTIDEEKLRKAMGEDSDGKPLLSDKVISAVMTRAKEVLVHVDRKIAELGETEAIYFR